MTLKDIFTINGQTVDNLEGDYKIILTNIITSLSDISTLLTSDHYLDYQITDKNSGRFDFNLPNEIHRRVIDTCIISKINQLP